MREERERGKEREGEGEREREGEIISSSQPTAHLSHL